MRAACVWWLCKSNYRLDLQATVYDDLHMGDFVAVVVSFANQKTEHAEGGVSIVPNSQNGIQQYSNVLLGHADTAGATSLHMDDC